MNTQSPSLTPTGEQLKELFDLIARQAGQIEAQADQILDLSERLTLYERRMDALAAYFREAAYVL